MMDNAVEDRMLREQFLMGSLMAAPTVWLQVSATVGAVVCLIGQLPLDAVAHICLTPDVTSETLTPET